MANTPKNLYGNTLGTTTATLYTVPAITKTIVNTITLNNKSGSAATVTMVLGGVEVMTARAVTGLEIIGINDVLEAGQTITAFASVGSTVTLRIAGVEVA